MDTTLLIKRSWTDDETSAMTALGFELDTRGYYVPKNWLERHNSGQGYLTLTKRFDGEFNELFYQAFSSTTGMQISVAANHIENPFQVFIQRVEELNSDDIRNFQQFGEFLTQHNIILDVSPSPDNLNTIVKIDDDVVLNVPADTADLELQIVYLALTVLKNKLKQS